MITSVIVTAMPFVAMFGKKQPVLYRSVLSIYLILLFELVPTYSLSQLAFFDTYYSTCHTGKNVCSHYISLLKCDKEGLFCSSKHRLAFGSYGNSTFMYQTFPGKKEVNLSCSSNKPHLIRITNVTYMLPMDFTYYCQHTDQTCNKTEYQCLTKECTQASQVPGGYCNYSDVTVTEMLKNSCLDYALNSTCIVRVPRIEMNNYRECIILSNPYKNLCSENYHYCYAKWVEISYSCKLADQDIAADRDDLKTGLITVVALAVFFGIFASACAIYCLCQSLGNRTRSNRQRNYGIPLVQVKYFRHPAVETNSKY